MPTTYRIVTRISEVTEGLWHVSASASLVDKPRHGVVTRDHECSSEEQARDFLEILIDQVRSAVEATGGEIIWVDSTEQPSGKT